MAVSSNTATAAKKKPRGKPFVAGDNRANRNGQRSKEALAFATNLRGLLVTEGEVEVVRRGEKKKRVNHLVRTVWEEAMSGKPWAVEFIADRVEGKVSQPVGGDPDNPLRVIFEWDEGDGTTGD